VNEWNTKSDIWLISLLCGQTVCYFNIGLYIIRSNDAATNESGKINVSE